MTRLPLAAEEPADPVAARIFDQVRSRLGEVPTLYRVLGNAPKMLDAWISFAWPLRLEATTSRGLRELMIMRIAQLTGARYEWEAHRPMALKFGVSEEQLERLDRWEDGGIFDDEQRTVLRFTDEITRDIAVSDDAFAAMATRFDPAEMVELTLTAAFYSCVSRVLRTLGIEPEDGSARHGP